MLTVVASIVIAMLVGDGLAVLMGMIHLPAQTMDTWVTCFPIRMQS